MELSELSRCLAQLGSFLREDSYDFHTPTPSTHLRVLARPHVGNCLQSIFGWNRPFDRSALPGRYHNFLDTDELFTRLDCGRYRANVRFGALGPLLLVHSGFPTDKPDAVFFGPDTYRFAHALRSLADREPGFRPRSCVDIGAGTGAGGLLCAGLFSSLERIALLDINPRALTFAAANCVLNGQTVASAVHSDILSGWQGQADLVISNPPYLVDPEQRAYRHGGGDWGAHLAIRILQQGLDRLSPNGHLLLYTGSAVVGGCDTFRKAAAPFLGTLPYRYDELDPDVFGDELDKWPYDQADRIAIVCLHVKGSDLQR